MSERKTEFSPCRRYRYTLWREWDCDLLTGCADDAEHSDEYLVVIGLNPSTADETQDDPTIRRCIGFAKRWGFGALCMTNLFAWRETEPERMKCEPHPVGDDNDYWLTECAKGAGMILAAWGKDGRHRFRAKHVSAMLPPLYCLQINQDGSPKHPLYVKADVVPVRFSP